jgi:hypothetical protein
MIPDLAMSKKRQFEPSWYPGAGMDSMNRISFTDIDMDVPKSAYDHSERSSGNARHFLAKTSSLFQELEVSLVHLKGTILYYDGSDLF